MRSKAFKTYAEVFGRAVDDYRMKNPYDVKNEHSDSEVASPPTASNLWEEADAEAQAYANLSEDLFDT